MPKHTADKISETIKKRREHLKKIAKTGKVTEVRASKKMVKRAQRKLRSLNRTAAMYKKRHTKQAAQS